MPKYRRLHSKIRDSRDVNDMPDDFMRLAWTWLPLALDSEGRSFDDAQWLRSTLFPKRRNVEVSQIAAALDWWGQRGMIVRYEANGERYFFAPSFKVYQSGTDREAPSVIPPPCKESSNSGVGRDSLTTYSRSDADAGTDAGTDASASADSRAESGAAPPAAPPGSEERAETSPTEPDANDLTIALTTGGELLLRKYGDYQSSRNRKNTLQRYSSVYQRDAYVKVFSKLGDELESLIAKGFAYDRAELAKMLSWLEGCVRENEKRATNVQNHRPATRQQSNQPAGQYGANRKPFDPTRPKLNPPGSGKN